MYSFFNHHPIKQLFTAFNVSLLGLASLFDCVIHASRWRTEVLVIPVCSFPAMLLLSFPSSSIHRHNATSAAPAARSVPVRQANRIFGCGGSFCGECWSCRTDSTKGGTRWRCERRAREPSFPPFGQGRWRVLVRGFFVGVFAFSSHSPSGEVGAQMTIASQLPSGQMERESMGAM